MILRQFLHTDPRRRARSTYSSPKPMLRGRSGAFSDHDVLVLGNVTAEILHTPGHTPEHKSVVVTDRTRSDEPWFVLTGHTLMVGDVGEMPPEAAALRAANAGRERIELFRASTPAAAP